MNKRRKEEHTFPPSATTGIMPFSFLSISAVFLLSVWQIETLPILGLERKPMEAKNLVLLNLFLFYA
jgi:hypothetical protein